MKTETGAIQASTGMNQTGTEMIQTGTGMIQTVTGVIPPSDLGYCQSHEHLFIADGPSARLVPSLRLDDYAATCTELELYKQYGGKSIVDAQPVGCGRIADFQEKAAAGTGTNIIASTGFHKMVFYPYGHWIHDMDESELAELFMEELQKGMHINCDSAKPVERITARAGVIKTASDADGPTGEYVKLFRAAAEAATRTGSPIMSHTELGIGALDQIRLFTDYNVSSDSLIICHLDRVLTDGAYLMEVASTGVYLELDTIGRYKYHSDEEEARFILKLLEQGYEDKILVGLDTTRQRMKSYGGELGLDYMFVSFFPLLKSYGVSDATINKFTVSNPAKAFTIKSKQMKGVQK